MSQTPTTAAPADKKGADTKTADKKPADKKVAGKPAATNAAAKTTQSGKKINKPAPVAAISAAAAMPTNALNLLKIDPVRLDIIVDDVAARVKVNSILTMMTRQTYVIVALVMLLVSATPFFQPFYQYFALSPEKVATPITPLDLPNLTSRAVLSWAANSVTEIMTIGFGDFDVKLGQQQRRFTENGWDAFARTFLKDKIDESFRKHQLVLTTVPSDTPVIISQGPNDDDIYEWKVQMPIIMTFATNNNVTRSKPNTVIQLTIVRVPYDRSVTGIAIDSWKQINP